MDKVKAAGYQPLLYSGAYLMNNNINASMVTAKYPNSLWVASYASAGRIDTANFNYFPSMDGVAIWQFTDNWRGLSVDGNISLLPLSYASANATTDTTAESNSSTNNSNSSNDDQKQPSSQAPTPTEAIVEQAKEDANKTTSASSEVKTTKTVMHKAYVYDKDGNHGSEAIGAYNQVTVLGGVVVINGREYYKIGENRYVVLNNIDGKSEF